MYTPDTHARGLEPGGFKMLITPTPHAPNFEKREEDGYNIVSIKPGPSKDSVVEVSKKHSQIDGAKQSN